MIEDFKEQLAELKRSGRYRGFTPLEDRDGCRIECEGQKMLNLTSNDYLGLAGDKTLHEEFFQQQDTGNLLDRYGLGSGSSRLLTGDNPVSHQLELIIRESYGSEACLLFNSGYHANIGILPALFEKGDLILTDKLNHASLVDGMRLSRASYKRFRHADYAHLRQLLEQYRAQFRRVVLVTESVFSMDGDVADLRKLVELKNEFNCILYVDEAHGTGLYGKTGLGMAEEMDCISDVDILVGTFGKAVASVGSYLVCQSVIREYLINHSRSLIFTTALPPVVTSWNAFVFSRLAAMEDLRRHLKGLSQSLRDRLIQAGLKTAGSTNIVPVMIGEDARAVQMGKRMREEGYLVFPVRPPTVPEGSARFRLSLTANLLQEDLDGITHQITKVFQENC